MRLSMRVWDLPVRLFHWSLALLLLAAWATARTGHPAWHARCGEAALSLVLWRLVWGFVGGDTARFARILARPPTAGLATLARREPDDEPGPTPAGAWLAAVLLVVVLADAWSGLLAPGGPLAHLLAPSAAGTAAGLHRVLFVLLLALVALHLLGVAAYAALKGQDLLRPMLSGKKRLPAAMRAPRMAPVGLAVLVLLCAAGGLAVLLNALAR